MQWLCFLSKIVMTVLILATTANAKTLTSKSRTRVIRPDLPDPSQNLLIGIKISRNTNVYELDDGTKNDNLNFEVVPTLQTSIGSFRTAISYVQNLRGDRSTTISDWNDIPFTYIFPFQDWISKNDMTRLTYSVSAVAPVSKNSTKRDQLKTSLSGRFILAVTPNEEGLTYSFGVSAGRSFHAYEEDENDTVLNQYFSNQNISFGYRSLNWNIGLSLTNRYRLTYANDSTSNLELSEELGFNINDNTTLAIGHTNAGQTLKSNATDLNMDLYNENVSSLYATLGFNF